MLILPIFPEYRITFSNARVVKKSLEDQKQWLAQCEPMADRCKGMQDNGEWRIVVDQMKKVSGTWLWNWPMNMGQLTRFSSCYISHPESWENDSTKNRRNVTLSDMYDLLSRTLVLYQSIYGVMMERYVSTFDTKLRLKNICKRAFLVAQWLRICLPMQGTRVRALVWEDPTCRGATSPVSHNYWACACGVCAPQQERPRQWEARAPRWRVAPARRN